MEIISRIKNENERRFFEYLFLVKKMQKSTKFGRGKRNINNTHTIDINL